MTLTLDYPPSIPDAMNMSPEEFEREARFALASKLFETGRLSSGLAANLAGLDRVQFLRALGRNQISMSNIEPSELATDAHHA